jgi:hypothetical protein
MSSSSGTSCSQSTRKRTDPQLFYGLRYHTHVVKPGEVETFHDQIGTEFEVSATLGSKIYGILSNPFLDRVFHTVSFCMRVVVNDESTWSYEALTQMRIHQRETLADHIDRNTLKRTGEPTPNPLATVVDA